MITRPKTSPVDHVKLEEMSWEQFEQKLTQMLLWLEPSQFLCVQARPPSLAYVQIGITIDSIRVETASNRFLHGEEALTEAQMVALEALGWSPPSDGPGGSPNFHRDYSWPVRADWVTGLTVRTLSEVLGVPAPSQLGFKAGSWDGSAPMVELLIATFGGFAFAKVERPIGHPQPFRTDPGAC